MISADMKVCFIVYHNLRHLREQTERHFILRHPGWHSKTHREMVSYNDSYSFIGAAVAMRELLHKPCRLNTYKTENPMAGLSSQSVCSPVYSYIVSLRAAAALL